MSDGLLMALILPFLLVCSAIASGAETALFRLSYRERADLLRDAPGVGRAVALLLAQPRRLLLMILIVNMIVNLAYFVVSSILTARVGGAAMGVVVGVGSVLAIVLFGEILAKVLAGTGRRGFCMVFARPIAWVLVLLGPLLNGVDRFVLSPMIRVVVAGGGLESAVRREDLVSLVESGQDSGVIGEHERRLLEEVLELGELRVREAMQPRDRIVWVCVDAGDGEILSRAAATRATTMLVCRGGLDDGLVGFLHVKRYLAALQDGAAEIGRFCEALLVVPEQGRLDVVLELMRVRGATQAVCVDERGTVVGMIRASDIVDELLAGMGEDAGDERHAVHLVRLGVWSVRATLSVRDWAQFFSIDESVVASALPRASTVGGLILDRLGRLARVGDEVVVGRAGLRVARVHGRRIEEVEVWFVADEERAGLGDGEDDAGGQIGGAS